MCGVPRRALPHTPCRERPLLLLLLLRVLVPLLGSVVCVWCVRVLAACVLRACEFSVGRCVCSLGTTVCVCVCLADCPAAPRAFTHQPVVPDTVIICFRSFTLNSPPFLPPSLTPIHVFCFFRVACAHSLLRCETRQHCPVESVKLTLKPLLFAPVEITMPLSRMAVDAMIGTF